MKAMANTHAVKHKEEKEKSVWGEGGTLLHSFTCQPAWLLELNYQHQLVWMQAFVEMKWLISALAPKLRDFSHLHNHNLLSQNTCGDPRQKACKGSLVRWKTGALLFGHVIPHLASGAKVSQLIAAWWCSGKSRAHGWSKHLGQIVRTCNICFKFN